MKKMISWGSTSTYLLSFTIRGPCTCRYTPISSATSVHLNPTPTPPTPIQSKLPLFLRPPIYTASVSDVQKWENWAKSLANSVGTKFLEADNGPESHLLCREIRWLLQDVSTQNGNGNGNDIILRVELNQLYSLWKQRIEERKPFQYIVGCEHWRDLVLSVEEGVLIPRPETEQVVDMVQHHLEQGNSGDIKNGVWADLGTGSGALAIAIARILGNQGRVIATDLSSTAASVAAFNVQRYGLQDKVEVRLGSWFEPLKDVKGELVGLVSNPPYIPSDQILGLQAEVARHEPRLALDGGENGMDDLLHLCEEAASVLRPGGFFIFETNGEKQSTFLVDFMTEKRKGRFKGVRMVSDFAGVKRFVTGSLCV